MLVQIQSWTNNKKISTIYQKIKKIKKIKKISRILNKNPQTKGWVFKVRTATPRKPNSALRKVVKVKLFNGLNIVAYIPGIGHNLRKHSHVLIKGGGARDLPGVNYTCIRGVLDLAPVLNKNKRRSIYGVKKKENKKNFIRRKYRKYV